MQTEPQTRPRRVPLVAMAVLALAALSLGCFVVISEAQNPSRGWPISTPLITQGIVLVLMGGTAFVGVARAIYRGTGFSRAWVIGYIVAGVILTLFSLLAR
jgi:hypothetical protein